MFPFVKMIENHGDEIIHLNMLMALAFFSKATTQVHFRVKIQKKRHFVSSFLKVSYKLSESP